MKILSDIWDSPAVGLDIGARSVRIVVLTKFLKRIRLARSGEETLLSSSETAVIRAIQRLLDDLKIKSKEVVIHATGKGIRHVILDIPAESAFELSQLVRQQIARQLPVSIDPANLILSFHIVEQTEQGFQVLVSYCQAHAIEDKMNMVEKAGLIPAAIGSHRIDLVQAFAFSREDFFDHSFAILHLGKDQTDLFITKNSSSIVYREIDAAFDQQKDPDKNLLQLKEMVSGELSAWQDREEMKIERVIITGDGIPDDILENDRLKEIVPLEVNIEIGYPLKGLLPGGEKLEPKYSLAAGLALKKYCPFLNTIDLLPEDRKISLRKAKEKRTSLGMILGFGGLILILLMILTIIQSVMTGRLENSEEELVLYQDQISMIDRAQDEQIRLQRTYRDIERLVTQRSHTAELLEKISRIQPSRIWLQELVCEPEETRTSSRTAEIEERVRISGWAFNESAIATLLSNLENSDYFQNIQLVSTERISGDEVLKRSNIENVSLIRFTIQARLREPVGL